MKLVSNGRKKLIAYELEIAFLNPNVETALRNRIFLEQSFNILQVPKNFLEKREPMFKGEYQAKHVLFFMIRTTCKLKE